MSAIAQLLGSYRPDMPVCQVERRNRSKIARALKHAMQADCGGSSKKMMKAARRKIGELTVKEATAILTFNEGEYLKKQVNINTVQLGIDQVRQGLTNNVTPPAPQENWLGAAIHLLVPHLPGQGLTYRAGLPQPQSRSFVSAEHGDFPLADDFVSSAAIRSSGVLQSAVESLSRSFGWLKPSNADGDAGYLDNESIAATTPPPSTPTILDWFDDQRDMSIELGIRTQRDRKAFRHLLKFFAQLSASGQGDVIGASSDDHDAAQTQTRNDGLSRSKRALAPPANRANEELLAAAFEFNLTSLAKPFRALAKLVNAFCEHVGKPLSPRVNQAMTTLADNVDSILLGALPNGAAAQVSLKALEDMAKVMKGDLSEEEQVSLLMEDQMNLSNLRGMENLSGKTGMINPADGHRVRHGEHKLHKDGKAAPENDPAPGKNPDGVVVKQPGAGVGQLESPAQEEAPDGAAGNPEADSAPEERPSEGRRYDENVLRGYEVPAPPANAPRDTQGIITHAGARLVEIDGRYYRTSYSLARGQRLVVKQGSDQASIASGLPIEHDPRTGEWRFTATGLPGGGVGMTKADIPYMSDLLNLLGLDFKAMGKQLLEYHMGDLPDTVSEAAGGRPSLGKYIDQCNQAEQEILKVAIDGIINDVDAWPVIFKYLGINPTPAQTADVKAHAERLLIHHFEKILKQLPKYMVSKNRVVYAVDKMKPGDLDPIKIAFTIPGASGRERKWVVVTNHFYGVSSLEAAHTLAHEISHVTKGLKTSDSLHNLLHDQSAYYLGSQEPWDLDTDFIERLENRNGNAAVRGASLEALKGHVTAELKNADVLTGLATVLAKGQLDSILRKFIGGERRAQLSGQYAKLINHPEEAANLARWERRAIERAGEAMRQSLREKPELWNPLVQPIGAETWAHVIERGEESLRGQWRVTDSDASREEVTADFEKLTRQKYFVGLRRMILNSLRQLAGKIRDYPDVATTSVEIKAFKLLQDSVDEITREIRTSQTLFPSYRNPEPGGPLTDDLHEFSHDNLKELLNIARTGEPETKIKTKIKNRLIQSLRDQSSTWLADEEANRLAALNLVIHRVPAQRNAAGHMFG